MTAKNLHRITEEGTYCHVYNKGIENKTIFADEADFQVFLDYLEDYLCPPKSAESRKKDFTVNGRVYKGVPHQPKNYHNKIELVAYSLKPNHFHLILKQMASKSLQAFIRSLCTRYSIYYNKKYQRTGTLFAGPYKSVIVEDDSALSLLTRYLHQEGSYSTYHEYLNLKQTPWVKSAIAPHILNKKGGYQEFVEGYKLSQKESDLLQTIAIESPQQPQTDHQEPHLERSDLAKSKPHHSYRIPEFLISSTIFVLLLGIGIRNINLAQSATTTLGVATSVPSSPIPVVQPDTRTLLTVKFTDPTVPVNIREKPTTQSKIIREAFDGDKFEYVSQDSGWYQIILPDGSIGYIISTFVVLPENAQSLQSSTPSANINPSLSSNISEEIQEASPSTTSLETFLFEINPKIQTINL